ncbi:hypothetical protein ZWY2020_051328 [Hordeum vulgare]|nr:hypothetical protein ZWY2020_051328 [Hordeum vulgare]
MEVQAQVLQSSTRNPRKNSMKENVTRKVFSTEMLEGAKSIGAGAATIALAGAAGIGNAPLL